MACPGLELRSYSCERPRTLCHFSSAPVLLLFALSPSLTISFSFVQLCRHSLAVRTLLCPGETSDHDPLAVYGSIFTSVDGRCSNSLAQ